MANVRGVILNGAKYESEDTEARTLAGQAINQTETLENSVNNLETEFTNLNTFVADVNQTATTAATTATAANSLAQQAEARAQAAYELADGLGHQVGLLHDTIGLDVGGSWTLTEENEKQLFPFLKEGKASGKSFLMNIWAVDKRNNSHSGWILFSVDNLSIGFKASHLNGVTVSQINNEWEVTNNSDSFVTVVISTIMQP